MKFIIIAIALLLVLGAIGGVIAVSGSSSSDVAAGIFGGTADGSSDIESATAYSISPGDTIDSENAVDDVIEREHPSELARARVVITRGHGWVTVQNGKAAFVNLETVTKQAENANGDQVLALSNGKISIGKIKVNLQATQDTETLKSYALKNDDASVTGALVLNRQSESVYNDGKFAVWKGDLTVNVRGESFKGDVTMALENFKVGSQKIKEYKDKVKITSTGLLTLGSLQFKFQSTSNSKPERLDFLVYDANGGKGTLVLEHESQGDYNYVGQIKVEQTGDDDDLLKAKLKAKLTREGNKLSGPVTAELDKISSAGAGTYEGMITIYDESTYSTAPIQAVPVEQRVNSEGKSESIAVPEKTVDSEKDKSSNDNSNSGKSDNVEKEGFWKKFAKIFGLEGKSK